MSSLVKGFAGIAVTAALSSAAGAQGIVTQKNISLALAQTIANAALVQCQSMGYKVSVTVVDRAGLPLVMLRGDGAGLNTPEGSDRKAYTARAFSQPSSAFVKRLSDRPDTVGSRQYTRVLALGGGLPIKVGNEVGGSACPARPARTTSARRPASTKWPISSSRRAARRHRRGQSPAISSRRISSCSHCSSAAAILCWSSPNAAVTFSKLARSRA